LHLKGFEELADNHAKLFETVLQNPLVFLSARISPLDSLPFHEKESRMERSRVYFNQVDYVKLKIEGLRLNAGDTILLESFSPVEVKARSKTREKVLVNLLQNNYYGWRAMIDGRPAKVLTANMSFLSVQVPAGEHEVEFIYDPKGVKAGFWISICALLAGLGLMTFRVFENGYPKGVR